MYFFIGDIEYLEEPEEKEEDFWEGEKRIPVEEAIKIIESQKPFDEEMKEYREKQLEILKSRI